MEIILYGSEGSLTVRKMEILFSMSFLQGFRRRAFSSWNFFHVCSRKHIGLGLVCHHHITQIINLRFKKIDKIRKVQAYSINKDWSVSIWLMFNCWHFSVSPKGYSNQDLYVEVMRDLDKHLSKQNVQCPVLLIIDGAKAHISLEVAEFCLAHQIQPVLLKPNMIHCLQV